MSEKISFELNGQSITITLSPDHRFLDVLRKHLNIVGPKEGCGEGECGACSVLMDGYIVQSCILPLGSVHGKKIMTIEGYRETKRFKALQDAFLTEGASQCGICTPGMIMATEYLLSHNPHPTDEEIRHGLAGNLCRCTGYNMIIKAIKRAAKEGEGLW